MPDASTLGLAFCAPEYAVARMAGPCCRRVASAVEAVMASGITERDFVALHGFSTWTMSTIRGQGCLGS